MFQRTDTVEKVDPELFAAIQAENTRQQEHIELIASENYCSPAVMEAQGSQLTNKYAEGYPGRRYYGGCEYVDVAEQLAIDRVKQIFGADAANVQGLYPFTGGSRLVQNGVVQVQDMRRLALALLALVVPGGLWLAWHSGSGLLWIGAVGLVLGWAYSAPPLALMARGLGELAVALAWWLVVLGADYVQRRGFFLIPALTALSFAVLAANILLINGFPDAPADAQVGKRTLVVRLGPDGAKWAWLGLVPLLTGLAGWCPAYRLLGLSTRSDNSD